MANLDIYNKVKTVPTEAQKPINGGRLKGMTDINPMWRIKVLTETFGPVGIGWKYKIVNKHLEHGANDEIAAFVDIELFYKHECEWSEAIPGTGGSSFVTKESKGLYTSDECFKMALTDALSVACKALGVAADVYYAKDRTKYDVPESKPETPQKITANKRKQLFEAANGNETLLKEVLKANQYNGTGDVNACDFENIITAIKLKQAS